MGLSNRCIIQKLLLDFPHWSIFLFNPASSLYALHQMCPRFYYLFLLLEMLSHAVSVNSFKVFYAEMLTVH